MQELIKKLNGGTAETRLEALKQLVEKQTEKPVRRDNDANNHIHTIYSFSPYSPTKAAYMAYMAGLTSAGIMDHDSLSGVEEFKKAVENKLNGDDLTMAQYDELVKIHQAAYDRYMSRK